MSTQRLEHDAAWYRERADDLAAKIHRSRSLPAGMRQVVPMLVEHRQWLALAQEVDDYLAEQAEVAPTHIDQDALDFGEVTA